MLIFGHIAFGDIVSLFLAKILHISSSSPHYNILLMIGVIASIIPDLDNFILFYKYKSLKLQKDDSHRRYIPHTPLFWIIISVLVYIISPNDLIKYSSFFILAGSLSHLVGDSIEYGIVWFWPFSKKQYLIHKIPQENFKENEPLLSYYWKFFSRIYVKNWTFYVELIVILLALISIL